MKRDLHHIDDLFKQGIDGHEEMPSPAIWDELDKNLDKKNVLSITRKYANLKKVAIALLIFAFIAGVYALETKINDKPVEPIVKTGEEQKIKRSSNPTQVNSGKEHGAVANNPVMNGNNKIKNEYGSNQTETFIGPANNVAIPGNHITKPVHNTTPSDRDVTSVSIKQKQEQPGSQKLNNSSSAISTKNFKRTSDINAGSDENNQLLATGTKKNKIPYQAEFTPGNSVSNAITRTNEPLSLLLIAPRDTISFLQTLASKNERFSIDISNKPAKIRSASRHLSLTAFLLPEVASNHLADDQPGPRGFDRDDFKRREQYASSISATLMLNYDVNKNWSLQSGLGFMSSTIDIAPKIIFAQHDNTGKVQYRYNCSSGFFYIPPKQGNMPAEGDSTTALASKNTLQYIDVPLEVSYHIVKGKIKFSPAIGISANMLVNGRVETALSGNADNSKDAYTDINGLKPAYYNGIISVGAEYQLSKRIGISVAPSTRMALTAINKDSPVKSYPKAFGIAAGVHIMFE